MDAINITQDRIARSRLAGDPPDITISPKVGTNGLFDFHRAGEAMEQGARAAEKQIDELRALIGGALA
jgi:NTE family protein